MAYPTEIVTLADVQQHLGVTGDGARLQTFIDGLTSALEFVAGPVIPRTITGEVHNGGVDHIMLRVTPVLSVDAVSEYLGLTDYPLSSQPLGATSSMWGYSLDDPSTGLVVRRSSVGMPMPFLGGPRMISVDYTAGRATVPANIKLAMLALVQENYNPLTQGGRPAFRDSGMALDDMSGGQMIRGFLVPNYVKEMLGADQALPGIA